MRRLVLVSLGCAACIVQAAELRAQANVGDTNKVSATMSFKIEAQGDTSRVVLDVLLPKSIPGRQKIVAIDYSLKPMQVFEKDAQQYAQFRFTQLPKDVSITINAEIYRYDFSAARSSKERQMETEESLKQWLIYEQYLERYSPVVQEVAKGLSDKDEEETIRSCFDFVVKTLKRRDYSDQDYGAVAVLQQRQGDCTEFADLFITLCRAKGIPARLCQGYLLEPVPDTPKHDWAEAYTQKYGWVPFDPFYAHIGKATTFLRMRPVYLALDNQRRNGVLNNSHYWAYRFEGSGPVTVRDTFSFGNRTGSARK